MSVLQFSSLSVSSVPLVLQCIVSMLSISISDMSSNAHPFPETKMKLPLYCLLLCSIFTPHMPICVIVVQFYVLV